MGIISDIFDGIEKGIQIVIVVILILVVLFVISYVWQQGIIQDTGKYLIDKTPELLDSGLAVCKAQDIAVDSILTIAIHDGMLLNTKGQTKDILSSWKTTQEVTACQVVILDDLLSKEDNTHKIWRNQIGLTKAMKNIQFCTLIECAEEYKIIDYLEKKK